MTDRKDPAHLAAFRADAANTNEKPIYLGKLMLFSDQDLTALKHNLVYTGVVSTALTGLLAPLSNPAIPLVWRAVFLAAILTTAHSATIALWNLCQSSMQVHPLCSPFTWVRWAFRSTAHLIVATVVVGAVLSVVGPQVFESFHSALTVVLH